MNSSEHRARIRHDTHSVAPTPPAMSAHPAPPPPPQWVVDLNSGPSTKPPGKAVPDPPGYTASLTRKERAQSSKTSVRKAPSPEEMDTLKMKKAWEVAIAPAKQLPMNAIGTPASSCCCFYYAY